MQSNREIDVLIAEKVFGTKIMHLNHKSGWCVDYVADKNECNDTIVSDVGIEGYKLKRYSEDIKAAWELVEKNRIALDPLGRMWKPTLTHNGYKNGNWRCEFELCNDGPGDDITYYYGEGETPMLAICEAVLKTLEE